MSNTVDLSLAESAYLTLLRTRSASRSALLLIWFVHLKAELGTAAINPVKS